MNDEYMEAEYEDRVSGYGYEQEQEEAMLDFENAFFINIAIMRMRKKISRVGNN